MGLAKDHNLTPRILAKCSDILKMRISHLEVSKISPVIVEMIFEIPNLVGTPDSYNISFSAEDSVCTHKIPHDQKTT